MKTVCLSSGSKGNSIFIEGGGAKVLIDDGLTLSNIESRLKTIFEDADNIDAILLTHEHCDHLSGVKFFLKKHKKTKIFIPAFVKEMSIDSISCLPSNQVEWFSSSEFKVKDLEVSCFILPHDSNFCVGYSMNFEGKKVSVATDLGFMSKDTLRSLSGSDILFLESNHDENLLRQNPKYPAKTKKRILSDTGHLSNLACGLAIVSLAPTGLKQVVLSHLSEENNTPNLAYSTIKKILLEHGIEEGKHLCIDVAFQNEVGTIFNI
ncbi:MAG: MBL fold metallo-hydrolase [Clostridia bacterium]|nr:MBL fold metallo-hydrolase [Clostridia bacterium]